MSLSLTCTSVGALKCTGLVYQTIISRSLQWSSGSSRYYMHTDFVHAILLPEHTQARELIICITINKLLTNNWCGSRWLLIGNISLGVVDRIVEPVYVACYRDS